MTTLAKVAADLYMSLKMMPCRCQSGWHKGELVTVLSCSRCLALKAYEQLFPPSSEKPASRPSDAEPLGQARADL